MKQAPAFYQREAFLYVVAIVVSALLSTWISARETVINPDAICYLLSADMIGASGLSHAMQLCGQAKWPFYSMLIYGFAHLTHISYLLAANLWDGLFTILSVVTFITIFKELGATRRVLWLAAGVILLSHEFNSVRQYIVRDHGFWAFYLVSMLYLLRYFRTSAFPNVLGWSASLLLATLFRIEGAIFLLALPFVVWFVKDISWCARLKRFVTLNLLTILIGLALVAYLLLHPQHTLDKLGRVQELGQQLRHGMGLMLERYQTTKVALAQHVLTPSAMRDAGLVLFVTLTVWYLINVIGNLSWIYSGLVVYAWWSKAAQLTRSARVVLVGYVLVNVGVTLCFFVQNLFLAKRYLIALTLVLMIWVPFALERLLRQPACTRKRVIVTFVGIAIAVSAASGIFNFGYSKRQIREAGEWLAQHVPAQARLYSNDIQTMYYSNHFGYAVFDKATAFGEIDTIAHGQWKQYDYLALRVNTKDDKAATVLNEIHLQPVQVFENERGDKVLIYKIRGGEKKQ